MSNKKYPYIGDCKCGSVLFTDDDFGAAINIKNNEWFDFDATEIGSFYGGWKEEDFKNITLKYLTNTYGKCESQGHADFICKLACKHGFEVLRSGYKFGVFEWFSFYGNKLVFNSEFNAKKYDDSKLIHLPLPPKENEMEEVKPKKPIYTKEMHERGEYPPIGSKVKLRDGVGVVELGADSNGFFPVLTNGKYRLLDIGCVKPIPTIEDELIHEFNNHLPLAYCKSLAQELLAKYNITPKGE